MSVIQQFLKLIRRLFQSTPDTFLFQENSIDPSMKYLITGLGNIGAEYDNTRHNVGFEVLDALAEAQGVSWKSEQLGAIAEFKTRGRIFILLKPNTYMNRSGKSVRYWLQKAKVPKENLLVVVDDLHLPFGTIRLRGKGSDAGHNGLKDIDQLNGGNKYARLRVGIGADFHAGQQVNYVLGKWSSEEQADLPAIIKDCQEAIIAFGTIGLARAMNQVNKKVKPKG